jgi:predicted protein tyrosine phosphatase
MWYHRGNMKIFVLSRDMAEKFCIDNENTYAISITDPNLPLAKLKLMENNILRLQFHDIEQAIKTLDGKVFFPMTESDSWKVASFMKNNNKNMDILIVHCEAGISRSAGVAAAISKFFMNSDDYYFRTFLPNRWCYRKVLDALMKEYYSID